MRRRSLVRPSRDGTCRPLRAARAAQAGTAASVSPTPTGPAPGPPPPCGVEKVLWTLKCMTSKPAVARAELAQDRVQVGAVHVGQGARRVDGVEQLDDAGSRRDRASTGWSASPPPCVGRARARSASRSIAAAASDGTVIVREAGHRSGRGFVPCDESGTMTSRRSCRRVTRGRRGSSGCRSARRALRPPAGA